jgi:predicted transcriptional regulator
MNKKHPRPTEKEMEILQILWETGAMSVKAVHEVMGGDAQNGYTTILKLMQIMFEKGLVTRQKSGKQHLYKAVISLEDTRRQMVGKMIDTVFRGSAAQLALSALGHGKSTPEELDEIRKYLANLEKK